MLERRRSRRSVEISFPADGSCMPRILREACCRGAVVRPPRPPPPPPPPPAFGACAAFTAATQALMFFSSRSSGTAPLARTWS